jgi:hypothetical protein
MHRSTRFAAAGLTLGLLAGGATAMTVGVPGFAGASGGPAAVVAQTDPATSDTISEPGQHVRDALTPLVEDGTITTAQLDAVVAALEAARPDHGPRGAGPRSKGAGGRGLALDTVAGILGTTPEAVRDALRVGTSIADQAAAAGVATQDVVDRLVAELAEKLATAVQEGRLTQDEADAKLAEAPERIGSMLEATGPLGGGKGLRGPGGRRGQHAPSVETAPAGFSVLADA